MGEINLHGPDAEVEQLTAFASDDGGNVEKTPHVLALSRFLDASSPTPSVKAVAVNGPIIRSAMPR
jgi:hypothetical protein